MLHEDLSSADGCHVFFASNTLLLHIIFFTKEPHHGTNDSCRCVASNKLKLLFQKYTHFTQTFSTREMPCWAVLLAVVALVVLMSVDQALENRDMVPAFTPLHWALLDNAAHGGVAFVCWLCSRADAACPSALSLGMALLCGALASFLDVDHFVAAGSTELQVRVFSVWGF